VIGAAISLATLCLPVCFLDVSFLVMTTTPLQVIY
jgi:hypothetical protein